MSGSVRLVCRQSWDEPWIGTAICEPTGGGSIQGSGGLDETDAQRGLGSRVCLVQHAGDHVLGLAVGPCPVRCTGGAVVGELCERRVGTHGEKVALSPPLAQPAV